MVKIFLSLLLIFSLCLPALAQERQAAADIEPHTGISFPPLLGSLKKIGVKKYTPPELGLSYRYAAQPLPLADIYIYDNGVKDLGTGINDKVRTHFEEVVNEIFLMEKSGHYRDVKKIAAGEASLATSGPRLPALKAVFTYSQPPGKGVAYTGVRIAHVFLTAYKNYFLKIQFTYQKNRENGGKEALQQFLADFGKNLKPNNILNNPSRNSKNPSNNQSKAESARR